MYRFRILAGLMLAVALPAAAHTFGFSSGSKTQACLAIGNTTYRLAHNAADVTVRLDSTAGAPGLRIKLAGTPEDADFVVVDDGVPRSCVAASSIRDVSIVSGPAVANIVVEFAHGNAPADYRIYVRSHWIGPEIAAALFAAAHVPPQKMAGRGADRSN